MMIATNYLNNWITNAIGVKIEDDYYETKTKFQYGIYPMIQRNPHVV